MPVMHACRCREKATLLAKEAVWLMFVGTDNSAYLLSQAVLMLHRHPEWLEELFQEQVRLIAEFGPELERKVRSDASMHAWHACIHGGAAAQRVHSWEGATAAAATSGYRRTRLQVLLRGGCCSSAASAVAALQLLVLSRCGRMRGERAGSRRGGESARG
jgi:hypothetical protein